MEPSAAAFLGMAPGGPMAGGQPIMAAVPVTVDWLISLIDRLVETRPRDAAGAGWSWPSPMAPEQPAGGEDAVHKQFREHVGALEALVADLKGQIEELKRALKQVVAGEAVKGNGAAADEVSREAAAGPAAVRETPASEPADDGMAEAAAVRTNGRHPLYKTRLCDAFKVNKCKHGELCNFAHGEAERRQRHQAALGSSTKKSVDLDGGAGSGAGGQEGKGKGKKHKLAGSSDQAHDPGEAAGASRRKPVSSDSDRGSGFLSEADSAGSGKGQTGQSSAPDSDQRWEPSEAGGPTAGSSSADEQGRDAATASGCAGHAAVDASAGGEASAVGARAWPARYYDPEFVAGMRNCIRMEVGRDPDTKIKRFVLLALEEGGADVILSMAHERGLC